MTWFRLLAVCVFGLAGTLPAQAQSGVVSDDFNRETLNEDLWTFTDPRGDCSAIPQGAGTGDAHLVMHVAAGETHDLWTGLNHAPRILQPCEDTDLDVQAKWLSVVSERYQMQGITVAQDFDTLLRFEVYHDGSSIHIFGATVYPSVSRTKIDVVVAEVPSCLRVTRVGDLWSFYYGDGTDWTLAGSFSDPLSPSSVGVHAGNYERPAENAPAHDAIVDYFFNSQSPIANEDGPSVDADLSEISASPSVLSAYSGQSTITVTPRDSDGDLLGSGLDVAMSTDAGTLIGGVIDQGDGTYTQQLEGSLAPQAVVSATVEGIALSPTATVIFVPVDPQSTLVVADSNVVFADCQTRITVTPSDDEGSAVGAGLIVTIEANLGDLGPVQDNGDGTYSATFAGSSPGTANITVVVNGLEIETSTAVSIVDPADYGGVIAFNGLGDAFGFASIQESIDAIDGLGLNHIMVAPGVYEETVIVENTLNLTIEGACDTLPSVVDGFILMGNQHIAIRSFEIDARSCYGAGIALYSWSLSNNGVTVENCNIHGTSYAPTVYIGAENSNVTLVGNHIHHSGVSGIYLRRDSGPHLIADNVIEQNCWNGIKVSWDVEVTISNNRIVDNGLARGRWGGRWGIVQYRKYRNNNPELITLIDNELAGNNGRVRSGRSDEQVGNYHIIIDATDSQAPYTD